MRIKRGTVKNRRHKKVLKLAKGYRMSRSKLYRRAKQTLLHSGAYSFAHRKRRKSQKRTEWISTISAALSGTEVSYKDLVHGMKAKNIEIDRKNLSFMVLNNRGHFDALVKEAVA
jgi:large subunit ribosomal protein L20